MSTVCLFAVASLLMWLLSVFILVRDANFERSLVLGLASWGLGAGSLLRSVLLLRDMSKVINVRLFSVVIGTLFILLLSLGIGLIIGKDIANR